MSLDNNLHKILIVDFGSQFTQLIARRIRELGVFSDIVSHKKIKKKDFKQIFSGTFWLSEDAKKLGLIDGISSESTFFKKKFGEKVKIKKIKQPKSLKQKLGLGISSYSAEELVSKAKEELMFNKYGL